MTIEERVKKHIPLAKKIAWIMLKKFPPHACYDDVFSSAMFGLFSAARRHDPTKKAFPTYAEFRIKGAIIDDMRSSALVGSYHSVRRGIQPEIVPIGSYEIEEPKPFTDDILDRAKKILDPRSFDIIFLIYARGMTLKQVGEVIGSSESRTCQNHKRALSRLRKAIRCRTS